QPAVIALLPRASEIRSIPRSQPVLEQWLQSMNDVPEQEWVDAVDRVWRYQTDCESLQYLAEETLARRSLLTNESFEKLFRRLLFGMNFVSDSDVPPVEFLRRVIADTSLDEVFKAMAAYTLFQRKRRVEKRDPANAEIATIDRVLRSFLSGSRPRT